uniref:Gustatory receptor n=1 Tax=Trichogramma kaykai TaxID=54128 RepID=A0ABD2XR85_9HYME
MRHSVRFKIVYYWAKFFGLCPFTITTPAKEQSRISLKFSVLGSLYNLALMSAYTYCYGIVIVYRFELKLPRESTLIIAVDALGLTFQYFAIMVCWTTLVFRVEYIDDLLRRLGAIDDSVARAPLDLARYPDGGGGDGRQKFYIVLRFGLVNVMYASLFMSDYLSMSLYRKFREQADAWFWYNFPKFIIYIVYLVFVESIIALKHYYTVLNRELARLFDSDDEYGGFHHRNSERRLEAVARAHDDLTDGLARLTDLFGLFILFALLAVFIHGVADVYYVFQILKFGDFENNSDINSYVLSLLWISSKLLGIYFICTLPDALCREIKVFMFQLRHKRISVSFVGLFNLNDYLLRSVSMMMFSFYVSVLARRNYSSASSTAHQYERDVSGFHVSTQRFGGLNRGDFDFRKKNYHI